VRWSEGSDREAGFACLFFACLALLGAVACEADGDGGLANCRIRSVDKSAWIEANNRVLEAIPVYRGATKLTTYSFGEPASYACLPVEHSALYDSFSTYHTYALPPGAAPDEVLDFYDQQLADWEPLRLRTAAVPICDVSYRRSQVLLGVTACNGTLTLSVNHAAYR
jgi:hypothetical protein